MDKCERCKKEVSEAVANFSKKKYEKIFCYDCQKTQGPTKQENKPQGNPHTIILNGKQYVTHAGLLDAAHKKGLKSIKTTRVSNNDEIVVFVATVTMKDETEFTAYGDAGKDSTTTIMYPHRIRLSETRAVNRALRFATNIGMCSIEELGEK